MRCFGTKCPSNIAGIGIDSIKRGMEPIGHSNQIESTGKLQASPESELRISQYKLNYVAKISNERLRLEAGGSAMLINDTPAMKIMENAVSKDISNLRARLSIRP